MNAMKFFVAIALLAACVLAVCAYEQAEAQNQAPAAENSRQKRFPFAYPGAYPYAGIGYPTAYSSVLPAAYPAAYPAYGAYGYGGYPYGRYLY